MRRFVAVDLETTGIDAQQHYIAEVGLTGEDYATGNYFELAFSLDFPDGAMTKGAAAVNGWGQRQFAPHVDHYWAVAYLTSQLNDVHIVGKNPHFDESFLRVFMFERGVTPAWHHRLVDVGGLAWGWYNAIHNAKEPHPAEWWKDQPPNVEDVEKMVGIERETVPGFDQKQYHTALCDARWAYQVFRHIVPKED